MHATRHRVWLLASLMGVLVGCQKEQAAERSALFPEEEKPLTSAILDAQAACGARADATLYSVHFAGSSLNALGRTKLNLMLQDRGETLPLTVYLDLPTEDAQAAAAVKEHLIDSGLQVAQVTIAFGPNPVALHPAAPGIAKLPKTDNPPAQKGSGAAEAPSDAGADLSSLQGLLGGGKK